MTGVMDLTEFTLIEHNGRVAWRHEPSGRLLPVLRGGSGDEDPPPNPDGGGAGGDDGRTFTQADLDRIAGQARTEAKRTAARELAEQLGCTVEDAKAKIAAAAAAEDAEKTDAQRAREAADAEKAAAATERAEAARERLAAKVERHLLRAGVDEKALDRAHRLIDVDPDASDDDITTEIEALKADIPALFTPVGTQTPPPSGRSRDARPPAGGQQTGTSEERARARRQRLGLAPKAA